MTHPATTKQRRPHVIKKACLGQWRLELCIRNRNNTGLRCCLAHWHTLSPNSRPPPQPSRSFARLTTLAGALERSITVPTRCQTKRRDQTIASEVHQPPRQTNLFGPSMT